MDRRRFLAGSALAAAGLAAVPVVRRGGGDVVRGAPEPPGAARWDDVAYWAFADRVQAPMDAVWREAAAAYAPSHPMLNARMLLVHAAAALHGHTGAARRDDRARRLAERLVAPPWFLAAGAPPPGDQAHAPGWVDGSLQHLVVDAEIAEALAVAWRARDVLGLAPATARRIADAIVGTTSGPFWRYPAIRLDQISWYCRMYVAAVTVGGDPALLGDLRRQVLRFADQATVVRDGHTVPNLGGGYRFHYLPDAPERNAFNLDSPEYACITAGFLADWAAARRQGMPGLDPRRTRILSAWLERVLCGYWTHAGYLNWDTGLGFARWHQGKKLGLAQAALLGLAASDELRPDARHGAWAKALLDAGFALWDRWLGAAGGLPPANAFQVPSEGDNVYSQRLASARVAANAAKAVLLGLGERPGEAPPPLYAHDPDTGRLAITTPVYNTAVVPSSRRAFPYGGLDVARLFDAAQAPAGNVGGRPPAAFGMVIRDRAGRTLLASQRPLAERPGTKLLTLTRAPRGSEARLHAYPRRPYAGPFDVLDAHGTVHAGGARIRVAHRFLPAHVQTTWTQVADPGGTTAAVHFPSTGPGARIVAVLDDGAERRVRPGDRIALERVRHVHVRGGTSGYVVVPVAAPAGAVLGAVRVARQPSAPRAGPSARIELPRTTRPFLTARYAPARDPDEAARAAARLRAR